MDTDRYVHRTEGCDVMSASDTDRHGPPNEPGYPHATNTPNDAHDRIQVTIRYPADVHAEAKTEATRNDWSFNTYTIRAVKAYTHRCHQARTARNHKDTTP